MSKFAAKALVIGLLTLGAEGAVQANDDALERRGKRVFLKCRACHSIAPGAPHKVGPNLSGFYAQPMASRAGFTYSSALSMQQSYWTAVEIDAFLTAPAAYAPGTTMAFTGLNRAEDRAAVIAYLKDVTTILRQP
ncbi:MAG: c-type cytochrome [Pseudomonadota bacterium]